MFKSERPSGKSIPSIAEHNVLAGNVGVLSHQLLAEGVEPLYLCLEAGVLGFKVLYLPIKRRVRPRCCIAHTLGLPSLAACHSLTFGESGYSNARLRSIASPALRSRLTSALRLSISSRKPRLHPSFLHPFEQV